MTRRVHRRLSALQVKTAKGPATHHDGGGLQLIISASNAKRWQLRITISEKRRELVSLEVARERAEEVRRVARQGIDLALGKSPEVAERHSANASSSCSTCAKSSSAVLFQ